MAKKTTRKTATAKKARAKRKATGGARKTVRRAAARVVALQSECGIRDVAQLHEVLVEAVDEPEPVTLDASHVDRVDASVLQVLGAFVRDRKAAGHSVVWKEAPSESFLRAARLIDLDATLGLEGDQ